MAEPAVYTVDEAAQVLRLGRTAMYDAVRAGQVPGVIRIGRSIRISRTALDQLLGLNGDEPEPSTSPGSPVSMTRPQPDEGRRINGEGN